MFFRIKSLLLHNKKRLLYTASLRLCNTLIQAFPAILVARLLRTIENSAAPSTSILAATSLIAVLTIKMIVENLYFHNAVKLSTSVRGSVSGLIFDKSLRLPDGGGGAVVAKHKRDKKKQDDAKKKEALGAGGVLNLMQSDASILESVALQIHTIWDGPLQVGVARSALYARFLTFIIAFYAHLLRKTNSIMSDYDIYKSSLQISWPFCILGDWRIASNDSCQQCYSPRP